MKSWRQFVGALVLFVGIASGVAAQEIRVGGQVGAIGVGSSSGIGYGAYLMAVPYETVGLRVDVSAANLSALNYFGVSPMLAWFVPTTEEFRAGFLLGGGFHKVEESGVKFGVGAGAFGDFILQKNISVGGVIQAHKILNSSENVWSLMLSLSMSFGTAGSWDW